MAQWQLLYKVIAESYYPIYVLLLWSNIVYIVISNVIRIFSSITPARIQYLGNVSHSYKNIQMEASCFYQQLLRNISWSLAMIFLFAIYITALVPAYFIHAVSDRFQPASPSNINKYSPILRS